MSLANLLLMWSTIAAMEAALACLEGHYVAWMWHGWSSITPTPINVYCCYLNHQSHRANLRSVLVVEEYFFVWLERWTWSTVTCIFFIMQCLKTFLSKYKNGLIKSLFVVSLVLKQLWYHGGITRYTRRQHNLLHNDRSGLCSSVSWLLVKALI